MHLIGITGSYTNTILLPNQISGSSLIEWLDGADPNIDSIRPPFKSNITTWYDKSLHSNAIASSSGTFAREGGVYFSGSQLYQFDPGPLTTYTAFVMCSPSLTTSTFLYTTMDGNNTLVGNYNVDNPFAILNGPGSSTYYFGGGRGTGYSKNLLSWSMTPSTLNIYYMGLQNYDYDGSSLPTLMNTIGSNFYGIIYEIIIYSTVLSTKDRQNVEGYLARKWDIQTLLTNTHPYFIPKFPVLPEPPTVVSAIAGNTQVRVLFTGTPDGGSPILSYTAISTPGGFTGTSIGSRASSILVTGLTNGTSYIFTVTSSNIIGSSVKSISTPAVTPITVADAPTGVSAIPGNAQATVSWIAPLFNGYSEITSYIATSDPERKIGVYFGSGSSNVIVSGLSNGREYRFSVTASNLAGQSFPSEYSAYVIPFTVPDIPNFVSLVAENAQVRINWSPPSFNGGSRILSYKLTSTPGEYTQIFDSNDSSTIVTNLNNGTPYIFSINASNLAGESFDLYSSPVIPFTIPNAPASISTLPGVREVSISWTAPLFNGGSSVTSYILRSGEYTQTFDSNIFNFTRTNLANATSYSFNITASNLAGESLPVYSSPVTTFNIPGPPASVSVVPGVRRATVSWTTPLLNGGSSITSYILTSTPGGYVQTFDSNIFSYTVENLNNITPYIFSVTASNLVGESSPTDSSPISLATVPDSPLSFIGVPGNEQVVLTWSEPYNGGSSITSYLLRYASQLESFGPLGARFTVENLNNGTEYEFSITASNSVGESLPAYYSATPATIPNAPSIVSLTSGDSSATISWSPPTINGGSRILSYIVNSVPAGYTRNFDSINSTGLLNSLNNGTEYTFTISASNSMGRSLPSVSSNVIPLGRPSKPTITLIEVINGEGTLTFTPSLPNGSDIDDYLYSINGAADVSSGSATSPISIGTIDNGSYSITIIAKDDNGMYSERSDPYILVEGTYIPITFTSVVSSSQTGNTNTLDNRNAIKVSWDNTRPYGYDGGYNLFVFPWVQQNGILAESFHQEYPSIERSNFYINPSPGIGNRFLPEYGTLMTIRLEPRNPTLYTQKYNIDRNPIKVRGPITYTYTSVVNASKPSPPTITYISIDGVNNGLLNFTAGSANGAQITGYSYSINSGAYIPSESTTSPINVGVLLNFSFTRYTFTLIARSFDGVNSDPSEVYIKPAF